MTRVLLLSDSPYFYPPFLAGGSVGQLREMAQEFRLRGLSVSIVARRGAADKSGASVLDAGVPIRYLSPGGEQKGRAWSALLPNAIYMLRVFGFLVSARNSYDVIVLSGFRLLAVPAGLTARLLRKRCIVRMENSNDLSFRLAPKTAERLGPLGRNIVVGCVRLMYWLGFQTVHKIVAFTPEIAASLQHLGAPTRKVVQIPNGVDEAVFAPIDSRSKSARRARLGLPTDPILFLYTGRLALSKGVMQLLEVWRQLVQSRADLLLVLLGSGSESLDDCEKDAREFVVTQGLHDSVLMRGKVANVLDYLQASDLFISLSEGEAFSVSILEALSVGLPSILTRVGGAPDKSEGDWGELLQVRAPTAAALTQVQRLLARQAEWPRMSAVARHIVERHYTIKAVVRRYLVLFEEMNNRR